MKIKTGTIVRTVVLILTLVNTVLSGMGKNPLPWSEDELFGSGYGMRRAVELVEKQLFHTGGDYGG